LAQHERRVALVPAAAAALIQHGLAVLVEHGAGDRAGYDDAAYVEAGAVIAESAAAIATQADVLATVGALSPELAGALSARHTLIGFHDPKTRMLFGDARKSLAQLVQDVQDV
jgi:NAD(P) transhydrogenase subunit alpha